MNFLHHVDPGFTTAGWFFHNDWMLQIGKLQINTTIAPCWFGGGQDSPPHMGSYISQPDVVTDAWPGTKTSCEEILSLVLTSFDRSPLSVLELTALAAANLHFYQLQWPRCSILFDFESAPPGVGAREDILEWKLESLGFRLHRSTAKGTVLEGAASRLRGFREWAEEDRCRAAWALAVLLHAYELEEFINRDYLVRFLAAGLATPAPWASMSTASAMAQLVGGCYSTVHHLLAEVGATELLVQLLQKTSAPVQQMALKAIADAGEWANAGDSFNFSSTNVIPTIISIAQFGCYPNQREAVRAIGCLGTLANGSDANQLKVVIPDVLKFLAHERDEMKQVAAAALVRLLAAGQDFVTQACEHDGIPKLIDVCWRATGYRQHILLVCLELITIRQAFRIIALQHGILPLLFQSLQDWNDTTERHRQRPVLAMLLCYPYQCKTAFLQETQSRRTNAIRQMLQVGLQPGNPNIASVEEVLQQLMPELLEPDILGYG